jgi:hypothetical protein
MYPWPEPPAADTVKPDPAINAVQVALDRRDNGGAAAATPGAPTAGPTRQ